MSFSKAELTERLIGIGYWRSLYESTLPDPAQFVDFAWPLAARQMVADYLQKGRRLHSWMGYSWCRFRCGVSIIDMGACDLTDGTYYWPEGLAHYVAHHGVRLPDEVVKHILAQPVFPTEKAVQVSGLPDEQVNWQWWLAQRGWNTDTSSFLSETDHEIKNFVRRYDQGKLCFEDYSEAGLRAVVQLVNELKSHPGT